MFTLHLWTRIFNKTQNGLGLPFVFVALRDKNQQYKSYLNRLFINPPEVLPDCMADSLRVAELGNMTAREFVGIKEAWLMWQLYHYPGPKLMVNLEDIHVTGSIRNQFRNPSTSSLFC